MSERISINNQVITAQIIQILEENDKNVIKVRITPSFLDIPIESPEEAYLGDEINIDCNILVNKITPKVSLNE